MISLRNKIMRGCPLIKHKYPAALVSQLHFALQKSLCIGAEELFLNASYNKRYVFPKRMLKTVGCWGEVLGHWRKSNLHVSAAIMWLPKMLLLMGVHHTEKNYYVQLWCSRLAVVLSIKHFRFWHSLSSSKLSTSFTWFQCSYHR